MISHDKLLLTYLEINGFVLSTNGLTILIDPILEGPLDFGIPEFYTAKKRNLPPTDLIDALPPIDCILLTQGLDDHAHVRTLTKLASDARFDAVPIVAAPSAEAALEASGMLRPSNVRFLRHGERTTVGSLTTLESTTIDIRATAGALVGPPWQTRENGYILRPSDSSTTGKIGPSVYIEPHVEFQEQELKREAPVDVVITPIVGQRLRFLDFDLVYGPEQAVRLVNILRPKVVIPMMNANVDDSGIASNLVSQNGKVKDFYQRLEKSQAAGTKIQELVPGNDVFIEILG